jgi:septum formation protein
MRLILASGSATRAALLTSAGVPFSVRASTVDERALEAPLLAAGTSPAALATALADAKALTVSNAELDALVIGADQTLDLVGARFTKPADRTAAREQLERLSGRTHQLHSALAVAQRGTVVWRHIESATLTVRKLRADEIDAYLAAAGDRVTASVGGYQIEGLGVRLFDRIAGDHSTILGLPLVPLLHYLRSCGVLSW